MMAAKNVNTLWGSTKIKPKNGDKNLGYITADVFDSLILVK